MSTIICSAKIPEDLREASKLRESQLGYPSWSAYIVALIRADTAAGVSHELPRKVAQLPAANRDRIDAEILEKCRSQAGADGPAVLELENLVQITRLARQQKVGAITK